MSDNQTRCGYVAIVGRPNVGKSTLLNRILDYHLSITSHKQQTTRHQILGIKSSETVQAIYVDTPGIHKAEDRTLNRLMNKSAFQALKDVDVAVFVVAGLQWREEDESIVERLQQCDVPVCVVINKIDRVGDRKKLLPHIGMIAQKLPNANIIPISALKDKNCSQLEKTIATFLPKAAFFYDQDQLTDRSEKFLVSELIRERLTRYLHKELPYDLTVEIEEFKKEDKITHIGAVIWVERDSQKKIIIGKQGEQLKEIGSLSRQSIEKLLDGKVMLKLWVKVKSGWANNETTLKNLGY